MLVPETQKGVGTMIGPRIAALRRERGLSQSELAQRIQVSPSALGMYEQGRREPSAETMVALAECLGVTTDFLLTGRVAGPAEADALSSLILSRVTTADRCLEDRKDRPFSREELAVLMAALLLEP